MSTPPRAHRRAFVPALLVALVATGLGVLGAAPAAASGTAAHYAVNRPLCSAATPAAQFLCFAVARVPAAAGTPGAYRVAGVGHGRLGGYSPADLAAAYGYNPSARVSQTVAVVDWYDDPNVAADLAAFDTTYHLAPETSRSFRKVNQNGRTAPLPARSRANAPEIALDVQAVRAVCHTCRILLVEANAPTSADLAAAENTAVRLGANEISNSYGGLETTVSPAMLKAFRHPGVVITASTGDDGWLGWDFVNADAYTDGAASFPASDPFVVAVGGTTLRVNTDGTRKSETVWNNNGVDDSVGAPRGSAMGASGGGCSRRFAAGTWQWHVADYAGNRCGSTLHNRVAADVAVVADPHTGFDVRDSYGHRGWITVGGTSLSSPLVAAMYALAGGSGGSAYPAASLYVNSVRHPGARFDVVQGGNSFCGGETDLQQCMDETADLTGGATNNPNGITGDALDCSFPRNGATASVPPTPGRQCNAQPGFDGPTGLGTPAGLGLFLPTSGFGAVLAPTVPRLHRSQTWTADLRERLSGATFTSYRWSWGDGSPSTTTSTAKAVHTFTRAGRYAVSVAAADSLHQVIVRTRVIRVGLPPLVHYSGPTSLVHGHRGLFSAAGSRAVNTGAYVRSITWHWGDGHITGPSTDRRVTHRYAHAGTYWVTLTVRDTTGVAHSVRHKVTVY